MQLRPFFRAFVICWMVTFLAECSSIAHCENIAHGKDIAHGKEPSKKPVKKQKQKTVFKAAEFNKTLFKPPVMLFTVDGKKPIDTDGYAVPQIADIDGDGKWDLMVGSFMNHHVWTNQRRSLFGTVDWYKNSAATGTPKLSKKMPFKTVAGKPVCVSNW